MLDNQRCNLTLELVRLITYIAAILPVCCRWWWRSSWRRRGGTGERWGGRPLRQRCGWEGEGGRIAWEQRVLKVSWQHVGSACSDVFARSLACHPTRPASLKVNAI